MEIVLIISTLLLTIPTIIYNAWVITILWKWFIIPSFQLTEITIGMVCGLILTFRHILGTNDLESNFTKRNKDKKIKEKCINIIIAFICKPSFVLLIGYIIKQYI